jgi:hypothetical protein
MRRTMRLQRTRNTPRRVSRWRLLRRTMQLRPKCTIRLEVAKRRPMPLKDRSVRDCLRFSKPRKSRAGSPHHKISEISSKAPHSRSILLRHWLA